MRGGAGPSGLDAGSWKKISRWNQFGDRTDYFCKTFVEMIEKLCTVKSP